MENKKQKTIHINIDDEINLIIDKIKECEAEEITLAIPENAVILQDLMNLKILKMNAEELKKNISIITAGNEADKSSDSANLKEKEPESKVKIHDIIKKDKDFIDDETKEIANANQEIKKEMEKNLLREKEFDQDKIKVAENIMNPDANKTNNSKKRNRKINLLPSLSSRFFAVFIVVCLVTTLAILGFVLPKSDIIITLKTEALTYDFEFVADELIDKIDAVSDKIPSEKIDITNEETGDYPATGKKHITEKATGKITIYNECSTGPQLLVANTRFLSKEGKIFRIKKSAKIAGFTKPEDKIIPGSSAVEVVAEESGESYNIDKTSFTIPKLQEINSWKFSCLYARSENSMSGGIDKEVLYFSDSDYLTAKEKLTKIVEEKNEKEFSDKVLDEYILLEYLEQDEEVKIKDDLKVGDVADDFQMTVSLKTTALLIAKDNLDNLINEKINSDLNKDIELVEGSREYEIGEINKDESKKIFVPVFVSQNSIAKIDIDKIKKEIAGKDELELRKYFVNTKGIKSTDIGFWPFWVKNIPSSPDKINITLDINNSM
jgi:hypothetical protein